MILLCGTSDGTRAPSIPWATFSNGAVSPVDVSVADRQVVLKKWYTIFKDNIRLSDYEVRWMSLRRS